ncbi:MULTISPECIES: ABC-three component system middle component 1 [Sphingobacterium]|jgi:hypothetical protein|uniref:ABC-three component system middle component 1 n=1 Tax=Sphingobacterium TaxID=28453 RepID=UPI000963F17A|nr:MULTISPECIES: ABC-three component system middle component 1 [Sphingobacterium]OJZ12895.1 MAG: hypothetical protein BGP15_15370 [Sphingobacterium sp. 40-24]
MKNCSDTENVKSIEKIYPGVKVGLYQVSFLGTINVFTLLFPTENLLKEQWKDLYSSIAAYFQADLPSSAEFERWNMYIFYVCRESVEKELQYKIENDRFACRKIVLGNYKEEVNDEAVEKIISHHITNTDLNITATVQNKSITFKKDEQLTKLISTHKLTTTKKNAETDIQKILTELEEKYNNEV